MKGACCVFWLISLDFSHGEVSVCLMKNVLGSCLYQGRKLRNQTMVHPLTCSFAFDCLESALRHMFGCPVTASRRLWTSYPNSLNSLSYAWLMVLGLQFCLRAYSLQKTWMAWEWETGWRTGEPSSASFVPLLWSTSNQDLDPRVREGFLALVGHKPAVHVRRKRQVSSSRNYILSKNTNLGHLTFGQHIERVKERIEPENSS